MRLVILFGPFVLLPFIVALIFSRIKVKPYKWTYVITYLVLFGYCLLLNYLVSNNNPADPSTKGWFDLYSVIFGLMILFVIAPLSLVLQKAFYKMLE